MKKISVALICIIFCMTYVNAQVGIYRSQSIIKKEKIKKPPFIGISAGIGTSFSQYTLSLDGHFGIDLAGTASKNNKFGMGMFFGYQSVTSVYGGPLLIMGNYREGKAFILGFGVAYKCGYTRKTEIEDVELLRTVEGFGGIIKLGGLFSKTVYTTLNVGLSGLDYYDEIVGGLGLRTHPTKVSTSISLSIGYKFNIQAKQKKETK